MEKDRKEPYIRQEAEGENLYTRLQRQTLEEVQRLSGRTWTDYNVHDPGVTLADIAGYALAELDYKLGFDLPDYLTGENGKFEAERFGLFPPEEVYTTAPVTEEDYRKLFLASIPELENVWAKCDADTGGYTVRVLLPPFGEADEKAVEKRIREVYNSHRNLCEHLDEVTVVQEAELEFHAELEIQPGYDASVVLARLYAVILRYLSGSVDICAPEEQALSGLSPEEWLEGSESGVRVTIPRQQNTEYELYKKLWQVEGVCSFSTCYLMKDGSPLTDFSEGYSLKIPADGQELKVRIRRGNIPVAVDMERFTGYLKTFYYTGNRRLRTPGNMEGNNREDNGRIETSREGTAWEGMEGTYRDIFAHLPVAADFPLCYRLLPDRNPPTSFEAYLKLYDLMIKQGLQEVKDLPRLLSIREEDTDCPLEGTTNDRDTAALKNHYMDFLDRLYGVESNPFRLSERDCYGETSNEALLRRMAFLRRAAYLTKNRAKARDITVAEGEGNVATVKEWFCLLLGIGHDESRSVGNVLHVNSLSLYKEDEAHRELHGEMDSMLIRERMLDASHVEPVTETEAPPTEKERTAQYLLLHDKLDIFRMPGISGGLFRGGIRLENYRLVEVRETEYILAFWNAEKKYWMNLEWGTDKAVLNEYANILRRFLWRLNRDCETLYLIEHNLMLAPEAFTASVVFPDWTARFHSPEFRRSCTELVRSLMPAHIKVHFYWADTAAMQSFELCYSLWRRMLAQGTVKNRQDIEAGMRNLLRTRMQEEQL